MKFRRLILRFCNFHRWRLVKDADDPRGDDESAIMREILDEEAGTLPKWFPSIGGQTHWDEGDDEDAEVESELDGT